jgi:hypothetical protein
MGVGDVMGGVSSFFGDIFGGDPMRREANDAWRGLQPDDINKLLMQYQTGENAYDKVRSDPFYDEASKGAVADLIRRGQSFGRDPEMQAAMREGGNQMRSRNQMAQGAVAQQGMATNSLGGGADMMNKMMAQQGSYEQAGNFGAQAAGQSQARSLDATKSGMAGAYEGSKQDWAAKAAKADAANRIGMFNANARRGGYQDAWNQKVQRAQGLSGQLMNAQQYPGRVAGAGGQALGGFMEFAGLGKGLG